MGTLVELRTRRLVLRPLSLPDADEIETLLRDRDIADTTMTIPHPYPKGGAAKFIHEHLSKAQAGEAVNFAVRRIDDGRLVGGIGLKIEKAHARAEIGYWIGKPFWNCGYCTEAAAVVVEHAFQALGLNRVFAHHMAVNPASGRIMQKIGMKKEATLRNHIMKWGEPRDVVVYGMTRSDYDAPEVDLQGTHAQ